MTARARRFPMLDPVRALAALWVMTYHAGFLTGFVKQNTVLQPFIDQAGVAPMTFFMLSGFLLYRPFAIARLAGRPLPRPAAYLWRRVLRVVPAYWVALTLITIVLGTHGVFTATGIPRFYGFAQIYDWRTALGGIPQAWTLCVEVTFYLFLPLWALLLTRVPGRSERARALGELGLLALAFAFSVGYKIWLSARYDPASFQGGPRFMPLPSYLDAFALGMGLGVISAWNERQAVLARPIAVIRRWPTLAWVAAGVVVWVAATRIGFTGDPAQHFNRRMFIERFELQALAAALLLLPAVFAEPGRGLVGRLLTRPALVWLGLVSYGFYLYHYAVVDELQRHAGAILPSGQGARFAALCALAIVIGGALAAISFYGLERPILKLKRLVPVREPATRGEALAEPASIATAAKTTNEISAG